MPEEQLPDKSTFAEAYSKRAPWDIGRPQPEFVAREDRITGRVLDCGCGTGDNAIYFAKRGLQVTGFDFLEEPIRRAKEKAAKQKVIVDFRVFDALALVGCPDRYDTIVDCGLFHLFADEDRETYVKGLTSVTDIGGRLMIICFSELEPGTLGPRRITERELRDSFGLGWRCERVDAGFFEVRPDLPDYQFSGGKAHAWFGEFIREGEL